MYVGINAFVVMREQIAHELFTTYCTAGTIQVQNLRKNHPTRYGILLVLEGLDILHNEYQLSRHLIDHD
jgi:hypothetical protein